MTHDYQAASSYIAALTGSPDTVMQWRMIHDVDKSVPAYIRTGTLAQVWTELIAYNTPEQGRGVFVMINDTDGQGRERENVTGLRAVFADLDNLNTAAAMYHSAMGWALRPHFSVWSSPGKYHIYWLIEPSRLYPEYESVQRKLSRQYDADPTIWDITRVLRVPGFYHLKNPHAPHLITHMMGTGWGTPRLPLTAFIEGLASVPDEGAGAGERSGLGDPKLAAPSLDWAIKALNKLDPNQLDRATWIKLTAAYKQAVSTLTDDATAFDHWSLWCGQYATNDPGENRKQWNDIVATRAGWPALRTASGIAAEMMFGSGPGTLPAPMPSVPPGAIPPSLPGTPTPTYQDAGAPNVDVPRMAAVVLSPAEQAEYFKGCFLIEKDGKILTPSGRFMDPGKFNARYGGKQFIIKLEGTGSTTDEAWKAATRGQIFQVPKVDHIRFLPYEQAMAIIEDELGRKGVNTYRPANIKMMEGDASRFVNHLRAILPTEQDVLILLNYLARIVQSPGIKIPWAPVIQSAEGVGKNVIKFCMRHAVGGVYTYFPKARELAETGGKFNGWMRGRLFILCDEVKTDEKRNLIETLKDLVSEELVEVQSKGVDQDLEDNFGNWLFFTNWKDAIPIDRKSRRWAIFFSHLQTEADILRAGLTSAYFTDLYKWIRSGGGKEIVAHYLKNYVIDPALDPAINQRAPKTSSYEAAIVASRTGPEAIILEAIEQGRPGFKGGWVSSAAVGMALKEAGVTHGSSHTIIARILESNGYFKIGRSPRIFLQEDNKQPNLYNSDINAKLGDYAAAQGYVV